MFILFSDFKKSTENLYFFPIEKKAANYAKINKIGILDAGFQQDKLVPNF